MSTPTSSRNISPTCRASSSAEYAGRVNRGWHYFATPSCRDWNARLVISRVGRRIGSSLVCWPLSCGRSWRTQASASIGESCTAQTNGNRQQMHQGNLVKTRQSPAGVSMDSIASMNPIANRLLVQTTASARWPTNCTNACRPVSACAGALDAIGDLESVGDDLRAAAVGKDILRACHQRDLLHAVARPAYRKETWLPAPDRWRRTHQCQGSAGRESPAAGSSAAPRRAYPCRAPAARESGRPIPRCESRLRYSSSRAESSPLLHSSSE